MNKTEAQTPVQIQADPFCAVCDYIDKLNACSEAERAEYIGRDLCLYASIKDQRASIVRRDSIVLDGIRYARKIDGSIGHQFTGMDEEDPLIRATRIGGGTRHKKR